MHKIISQIENRKLTVKKLMVENIYIYTYNFEMRNTEDV